MTTSIFSTASGLTRFWTLPLAAVIACSAVGCMAPVDSTDDETTDRFDDALTSAQKKAVSDHIKKVAAKHGITNPVLFAGVPNHESGLVQCWKDATWACQGPHSDYCGGPVIAGSGDGPCSQKQGGLGMYQLDAGTYSQTLASYGSDVVELDAQIDKGVDVIISKVWHCPNTPHYDNEAAVVAWLNAAKPGTAKYETFLSAMAYCYNGTPPGSSNFQNMRANYNAGVSKLVDAFGDAYWFAPAGPPPAAPTGCGFIQPGKGLASGTTHSSCSKKYDLAMQTDGNLVLYHAGVGAIWATGTNGKGGHKAEMQKDGNFVLYTAADKALWASGTSGEDGAYLAVQDDGNLVVYSAWGKALWNSHTNGK